jgi:peptidoglycan/xylan/chitin deacetylase (PgdA/CDA1 family)
MPSTDPGQLGYRPFAVRYAPFVPARDPNHTVLRSPHWVIHSMLGPNTRRRVRAVVDLALAPVLGAVNAGTDTRSLAVTLDDGPDPEVTPALIDALAALDVHATFFLLTLRAEERPDLVQRLVAAGHEIALHGLDHRRVTGMSAGAGLAYLSDAKRRLEQVAQHDVTMFRPPYGAQSITSFRAARRAGLEVVVWNGDAQDWVDRPGDQVAMAAIDASKPGGILLLHERLEPDPLRDAPVTTFDRVEMVESVVTGLRQRGLRPCSVGALRMRGGLRRTAWFRP